MKPIPTRSSLAADELFIEPLRVAVPAADQAETAPGRDGRC